MGLDLLALAGRICAGCLFAGGLAGIQAADLDMYWVDVEGGAATLIVTPAGESVLIDTGMPGDRDPKRIHEAAKAAGLERIDHLITTHFHLDHFGGAADLAELMPISAVYDFGIPEKNPDNPEAPRWDERIRPYREMNAGKRVIIQPGDEIPLKQREGTAPISLRCLISMRETIQPPAEAEKNPHCEDAVEKPRDTSDNANSIGLLLRFGEFEMFDGGDLTWNVEAKLACPVNLPGPVDVYDVNHHGLDQSNNPVLVRALEPTVAIMSNGTRKGCGPETFQTLSSIDSIEAIFQIHKNLREDSENNTSPERIANWERDCEARWIQVSVEPDGRSYSVSIAGSGRGETFQTR